MADQDNPQGPPAPEQPPAGGGDGDNKNLVPINIEDEMRRSYLDYSMSVIVGRALPDIRDGLKPVHRRILYGMHEMGLLPNRPTKKCARIVGDVLGKYHPHGDSSVYEALVRMAQDFTMRYPLVDGQGNFGSVDGDPPAAMRYTEARLSCIATALLEDIDKETVDFKPELRRQRGGARSPAHPRSQPAGQRFVGHRGGHGDQYSAAQPARDPRRDHPADPEAGDAAVRNPGDRAGPGFSHRRLHSGAPGHCRCLHQGPRQLKIRAKAAIERMGKDREQIVVTEIPYQVNKSQLIKEIAALVNEKRIEGISDVVDHSDRDGMRIVFELKRGEQAEVVLNNLYKHTQLQIGFGIIMLSIVNGQPRELGLVDMIKYFIEHRVEVVRRRTEYELRKAREREHILLGFQKALENLDEVIRLIRAAKSPKEARESLVAASTQFKFDEVYLRAVGADPLRQLTEKQAQAIIELQLQRLTGMEQQKILDELADIQRRIAEYLEILGSEKVLRGVIIKELKEVRKEYGDERRTQIVEDTGEISWKTWWRWRTSPSRSRAAAI